MKEHQEDLGNATSPPIIRWATTLLAAAAIAVAILALWPKPRMPRTDQGSNHPAAGAHFDEIELQPLTFEGADLTSSDLQGKVTFINFWGPWCGPCGIEFPHLIELEKKFRDSPNFLFVSVSSGQAVGADLHIRESTEAFLKQHRAAFPVYRDAHGRTRANLMRSTKLGTLDRFAFPTTAIVGKDGRIRGFWQGYADGDELAMLEVVQAALREK